jgi:glycine cleavage system H lipoate-binding protein
MVTLLFVSLIILFVLIDTLVVRRLEKKPPQPPPEPDVKRLPLKDEIVMPPDYNFHPGHTWALKMSGGTVAVGVDDLIQATTGQLTEVRLPAVGDAIEAGSKVIGLVVGGREIALVAPIGGVVRKANRSLSRRPTLVNSDPYGSGWLFEVEPKGGADQQLAGLPIGDEAVEWMKAEMGRMSDFVTQYRKGTSPSHALVGGNHEVWTMFEHAFLSGARGEA